MDLTKLFLYFENMFTPLETKIKNNIINDIKISRDSILAVSSVLIGEKGIEENSKN